MSEPSVSWRAIEAATGVAGSASARIEALFWARSKADERSVADPGLWPVEALTCHASALARAYELRSGNDDRRKAAGAFYTPEPVARSLIEFASHEEPLRILDPACGCGAFLVSAAQMLLERGLAPSEVAARLHGVDIDPVAVSICRGRLAELTGTRERWAEQIVVGDSLAAAAPLPGTFDLIVGNPPFGNAIEARTGRTDAERVRYSTQFPESATGAYDRAGLFVEAALGLLKPDGRLAFVLPRAMLSAAYAERLRAFIAREYRLAGLCAYESAGHFADAAVFVTSLVVANDDTAEETCVRSESGDRSVPLPDPASWAPLLSPYAPVLAQVDQDWPTLDEYFHVQASAAAGEAYDFLPHVSETKTAGAWRLLTTGSIEPFESRWGVNPTRYLKHRFATPWLHHDAPSARRAALYDKPKVLVAGLSKVLEAFADLDGTYAGAVATIALTPKKGTPSTALGQLEIFLNSWLARTQFLAIHGAQALGGGSVQVTKKKLAGLRFPPGLLTSTIPRPAEAPKSLPAHSARASAACEWDAAVLEIAWGSDWIDSPDLAE